MTLLQPKLVHFFYLFFYSITGLMGATSQYFEITGSGGARSLSIQSAFAALQSKRSADQIAADLLDSAMPRKTYAQQEALINAYNERLRKQEEENQKLAAQGLSPVRTGEDYASKLLARKAAEAEAVNAEMQQKLQADMDQEREQQRREREQQRRELEIKEKLLQEQEDALAKIKDQVGILTATLSPLKKELAEERARDRATPIKKELEEANAELKRLKSQMGGDVLDTILEERADSSDDGFAGGGFAGGGVDLDNVDPLKLELASYYGKIKGISEKLGKAAAVTRDCNEIEAFLKACLMLVVEKKITVGKLKPVTISEKCIPDENLEKVLLLMKQARDIACNYREIPFEGEQKQLQDGLGFITKWVDGHKETMTKKNPKERVKFLEECFDLSYLGAIKDEKEAIDAIDTLQLSLDLTLNLEQSIFSTKKLNLYLPSAFLEIDRIITSAISSFRAEIIKQDSELYTSYLVIFEQEKDWVQPDTNFSLRPTALHLLRNPMVLFMLKRPAKKGEADNEKVAPFASFGRISDEIRYLTENQKKALFASLYFVVFNYEEVSGGYLRETLLSNTPIQAVDIHPLIKELKESLKKGFAPLPYTPSTEQQDLAKFSVKVNDLLTGKTYREGITNRFASALISLGQKLDGISQEGIVEYLKTKNLPEEKRTNASRILAEHEFISREALNQQLVNKQKAHDSYVLSLEQSISKKGQREEEARAVTAELEERTLAKTNAQREKKEKEVEIEIFSKNVEESNKEQLAELGQKYEQLNELENKLIILKKSLAELGKKSKKLADEIELSTKKIQSFETNIEVIVPEIEKLADALRKLEFVSELERLSDDIDRIASRGQELFDFNRTLESCFELLTDLQSSTKKLVEAEEATATGGTSSASNLSRAVSKLGSAEKSKIEAVLRKAGGTADSDLAAQNAKKLKAMALVAAKEKREADAQEKKKADELAAVALAAKPLARPLALAAPAALDSATLLKELVLIEEQVESKKSELEDYQAIIDSIAATRVSVGEGTLPSANMKIKNLKKRFPIVVVLPPAPQAAIAKKEAEKIKLLSTIDTLTQQLEAKKSAISEDEYAELSAKLVSTKKMINGGNAMAQFAIMGLKNSIA